jgi:hypothetical protein
VAAALAALAEAADGVSRREVERTTEYTRGGVVFAASDDDAVELRLNPEVADAARRTPDTSVSSRGFEWVRFAPRTLDGHAHDRLEAWFLSAWRAASKG